MPTCEKMYALMYTVPHLQEILIEMCAECGGANGDDAVRLLILNPWLCQNEGLHSSMSALPRDVWRGKEMMEV